jgi:hypothetical protein
VEKPDSQRYVDIIGINARRANKILVISSKIYSPLGGIPPRLGTTDIEYDFGGRYQEVEDMKRPMIIIGDV